MIILTLDIQSLHKLDKIHYVDCCFNMPFLLQFTKIIVLVGHTTFTGIPILADICSDIADISRDINTDINIGWSDIFFTDTDITDIPISVQIPIPILISVHL